METAYFENDIIHIVARAIQLQKEGRSPVVIAIDGMAGAGKTTLSALLAQRLDAPVIHMDDFFLPQGFRTPERLRTPGGNVYYERFREEVSPYLRCGQPFAYRIFDAHAHRFTGTRLMEVKPFVIVEGSYSQHPEIGDVYDLRVFCKVSAAEQMRRVRERAPERADMFAAMWIPMENRYFEACDIEENSDIVVTSGPADPTPPLEIERKYLIARPEEALLAAHATRKIEIVQTYLMGTEKGISRRVRKSTENGVTTYRKNEKRKLSPTTRFEEEKEIDEKEYNILLGFADWNRSPIAKTRWCVPIGNLTAEIDIFPFWEDRAICEVELPSEDTAVKLPDWLTVLRDVTEDTRYTNAAMAKEIPNDTL